MSETKWTKGWEKLDGATVDDSGNFVPLDDDIVIVTGATGDGAEWDFSGEIRVSGEGAPHNAALVLASPALYEALEDLLACRGKREIAAAEAALRLARGEST